MSQENEYLDLFGLINLITTIKNKFSEKLHIHKINDIDGLQRRLDELTPPPDIETSEDVIIRVNQLSIAVNNMTDTINSLNTTINSLIPAIGEIYITTLNENPSIRFGGTWEQIKDMFLLASGDIYNAGVTGGEAIHTLTVEEMPSHSHTFQRHMLDRNDDGTNTGQSGYGVTNKTIDIYEATTSVIGNGQPHNNMPPYLVVYIWKMVA